MILSIGNNRKLTEKLKRRRQNLILILTDVFCLEK